MKKSELKSIIRECLNEASGGDGDVNEYKKHRNQIIKDLDHAAGLIREARYKLPDDGSAKEDRESLDIALKKTLIVWNHVVSTHIR